MANARGLIAKGTPPEPRWTLFLRIAIIVLSLAVFIAACYNVAQIGRHAYSWSAGPGGLAIFTVIFTWITFGLDIAFGLKFQQFYFRILFLSLYGLNIVFWLSTWAYAADVASTSARWCGSYCRSFTGSIAAVAALGAFTWIAIIVLTVFWVLAALKDATISNGPGVVNTPHHAELGHVKPDGTPVHPYGQQPYDPAHAQQSTYGH